MPMTLGAYTFVAEPSDFDIPKKERRAAALETYGGVAFYSWGALQAGQEIILKWSACPTAQFDELQALLEADAEIVWDPDIDSSIAFNVEILELTGAYHMSRLGSAEYRKNVNLKLVIISEV